jgi:hypothetical protein
MPGGSTDGLAILNLSKAASTMMATRRTIAENTLTQRAEVEAFRGIHHPNWRAGMQKARRLRADGLNRDVNERAGRHAAMPCSARTAAARLAINWHKLCHDSA